ncbi:MAG: hypothetical protein AAGC60_06415 [Acidobacteriota bacterium]
MTPAVSTRRGSAGHHTLGVALLAMFVQGAFLALAPDGWLRNESADYRSFYEPVARALLDGGPLVDPEGQPAVRYPIGFPALLAVVFGVGRIVGEGLALQLFTLACVGATAALVHRLALRFCGGRRDAALFGALAWCGYPPYLWLAKQPNSELPFLVLVLGAGLLWWRLPTASPRLGAAVACGALCGAAALVRPAAILLAVPLAVVLVVAQWGEEWGGARRRAVLLAGALLAAQLAVMAPWLLWTHDATGRWMPLSSGGRLSLLDGLTVSAKEERDGPWVPPRVDALMHAVAAERRSVRGPVDAVGFLWARDAVGTVQLVAVKAVRSWYATDSLRFERWLALLQAPILALAALGLWRGWRDPPRRTAVLVVVALSLYFWALTVVVLSILRYMMPAMALLMAPLGLVLAEASMVLRARLRGARA